MEDGLEQLGSEEAEQLGLEEAEHLGSEEAGAEQDPRKYWTISDTPSELLILGILNSAVAILGTMSRLQAVTFYHNPAEKSFN